MKKITCDGCNKEIDFADPHDRRHRGSLILRGFSGISKVTFGDYCGECTEKIFKFMETLNAFNKSKEIEK